MSAREDLADRGPAPAGFDGYPGPFPVGRYARRLQARLREFTPVCLVGEVTGTSRGRGANVYFELRDSDGAVPCAMWRTDFEQSGLSADELRDGAQLVVAGGCDYYPGGPNATPRFSFRVKQVRLAGEGDLLARLARLRRQLASEGLFELQRALARPALPRSIGVVTAEGGAARRDLVAALARRGWAGRIIWGYASVQDRRAAPAIAQAIRDLAAVGEVEAIVVTRGGGSIADLWAFCDETLCRTVALLPVPVIAAVGHETDRTLIDDVAAVSCSTPTHAAEAAVRVDCEAARTALAAFAGRLDGCARAAVADRARVLRALSRAPREHVARHRRALDQQARELRASGRRGLAVRGDYQRRVAVNVLARKAAATASAMAASRLALARRAGALDRAAGGHRGRRADRLERLRAVLAGHDPEHTLARGYALALGPTGEPLGSSEAVRRAGDFDLRLSDGTVPAHVREEEA